MRVTLLRHAWVQLLLVAVLMVQVNQLASAHFSRVDLTDDRRYTLSDTARQLMMGLQRPMSARVYFTPGLEAPYNNHLATLEEKLEELRAWSGGKLDIQVFDPTGDKELATEAQKNGIVPIQYRYRAQDRTELKQVFMGVVFFYGDQQETLPAVTNLATLEYDLVRAILRVTTPREDRKTIGYLTGHGEPDLNSDPREYIAAVRDKLTQVYDLEPVTLGSDQGVPEDVDAMLVIGPQEGIGAREQYQLDQFIMNGGPVAFFLSGYRPEFRAMRAVEVRHDLYAMLAHYGLKIGKDALGDRFSNEVLRLPMTVGGRQQVVPVNHPLVPVVTDFNREAPATAGLDRMVYPFGTTVAEGELQPGAETEIWATSSRTSSKFEGLIHIHPEAFKMESPGETKGQFPVVMALHGPLTSFFAEREIPPPAIERTEAEEAEERRSNVEQAKDGRIVVVGSADMVANNHTFLLNTLDWMLQDQRLLEVRTRATDIDLMPSPEPDAALRWQALIVGLPLSVLLVMGGGVWWLGRRRS